MTQAADRVGLLKNLTGMDSDLLADGRDVHTAVGAFKQHYPELLLEFMDLPRQSWLADKTTLCRPPKVQSFAEGNQVLKVLEVQFK